MEAVQLVRRVDGDDELFAGLYPSLRRFAAVADAEGDPDDLVQEAVARTLRRHPLSELDNPGAYLRRTILNLASNRRRGLARWRAAVSRLGPVNDDVTAEYDSDLADLLHLSPDDRALLFLVAVEDCTYAEAADFLGITEAAARTRASRARRHLRAELEGEQ
jgi:RNA polymerase sigma factor (sigma-70 family)